MEEKAFELITTYHQCLNVISWKLLEKNSETNQHIVDLVSVVGLGFYLPLWYRYLPIAPFASTCQRSKHVYESFRN